ncbi:MAG: hypothetical protein ABII01_06265 [Candidatus Woesearchaeota archaeon]
MGVKLSIITLVALISIFLISSCSTQQSQDSAGTPTSLIIELNDDNMTGSDNIILGNDVESNDQPIENQSEESQSDDIIVLDSVTHKINILKHGFDPSELEISKGDTVVWVSYDLKQPFHVVLGFDINDEGKRTVFNSRSLLYSDNFSHTYDHEGDFIVLDQFFEDPDEREEFAGAIIVR